MTQRTALRRGARRAAALLAVLATLACLRPAGAQEQSSDWRPEFEAVCVKTDLAMSLSNEELAELVARCDRLAARIGAEGEVVRRFYLKRLQSCRALFAYVLETRGVVLPGAGAPVPATPAPAEPGQPAAAPPPPDPPAPAPADKPAP